MDFPYCKKTEYQKISVIIPVYNTKEYLENCVNSVLGQTWTDVEVILIDDGSQDGSKELCEELQRRDSRIRLILQEHKGVSSARNAGIEAAEGRYLFFLDSDDTIHPQLLEALHKLQEENHGVIGTAGMHYADEGRSQNPPEWKREDGQTWEGCYLNNDKARMPLCFHHTKVKLDSIGGKMILREAVKAVRFQENLARGEDTRFLYELIANGADAVVLFRDWYYYRKNSSREGEYSVESCRSIYEFQKAICDDEIKNNRVSKAVKTEWRLLCNMVLWKERGRKNRDARLKNYVEGLIENEKKQMLFSKVDWCRKVVFYLGCVCYPLYKWIADVMYWYHTTFETPRELHNDKQ